MNTEGYRRHRAPASATSRLSLEHDTTQHFPGPVKPGDGVAVIAWHA